MEIVIMEKEEDHVAKCTKKLKDIQKNEDFQPLHETRNGSERGHLDIRETLNNTTNTKTN